MIESIGKVLVDPLAERWKNAAVGGSLACWLLIGALLLCTRDVPLGSGNWPLDCRPARTHGQPAWCTLSTMNRTALLVVGAVAAVISTAFLVQVLAPGVFGLIQAERWGDWPLARGLARRIHQDRRVSHALRYPSLRHLPDPRPTRVGNRFAALDERVQHRFGYELGVVWNVLVASLPQNARDKLIAKSESIILACQHLLLAGLATVAAFVVIPGVSLLLVVPLVLALVTVAAWRVVAQTADEYCDLILTMLILHRDCLSTALGEKPPSGLDADLQKHGAKLTEKIKFITR